LQMDSEKKAWYEARGSDGAHEIQKINSNVLRFLEENLETICTIRRREKENCGVTSE